MVWDVYFHDEFVKEFEALDEDLQVSIAASVELLEREGPQL